jgi:nicotinamidase-related amidase
VHVRPALLVVDAQQEYFAPVGKWVVTGGEAALDEIERLLAAFRAAGQPVLHIVHEALDPASSVFRAGSEGTRMHPRLEVLAGEFLLRKHFPGSFTQTPLDAYLRRAGVDTVVVTGFQTQHCCDATSRQARERGFAVLFTSDATATRDLLLRGERVTAAEVHRATLAAMTGFGDVVTAAEVVRAIAG